MTNSEDNPPPAVGAYWIKEEDYPALLQLFDDRDKMPPSWKEWLKMAEEMEQGLKAYGHVVLRVYIDPTTFPEWCAAHGTSPGSAGRRTFIAAAVTERYGQQARPAGPSPAQPRTARSPSLPLRFLQIPSDWRCAGASSNRSTVTPIALAPPQLRSVD